MEWPHKNLRFNRKMSNFQLAFVVPNLSSKNSLSLKDCALKQRTYACHNHFTLNVG